MRWRLWFVSIFVLVVRFAAWSQAPEIALHDGDRVAFYGDSITAQRLYTRFVEDFVLTRYPSMQVTFFNSGVPGDTVNGGYTGDRSTRLKRDLFPHEPTVVTIMLGMNDGYYVPFDPKYLRIYEDGYRDLIKTIGTQTPPARLTLISPTPYDEVTHGTEFAHYNEVVSRHAALVKELAGSSQLRFSDFNKVVSDLLAAGFRRNPDLASLLVPDRIHPGEASQWVMAAELAKSWGLSPLVSSVQIDASQARVVKAERSKVNGLAEKNGTLSWTQTDDALPLPLALHDRMIQFVLESSTLADMDREILRIDGLADPHYSLKIDGHPVGYFKREQLAAGVNLALCPTPMQDQAKEIDGIEQERTRLDETNFIVSIEDPKVAGAPDAKRILELKNAALYMDQRKAAQPKSHHFELAPHIESDLQ